MSEKNWYEQINVTQVVIALIIGVAILGYGYINAQGKKEELELKKNTFLIEAQAEKVKDEKYTNCEELANENYTFAWNGACKSRSLKDECQLPSSQADTIETRRTEAIDRCVTLYK